ncbi:MAG: DUF1684 domain-containing protein [Bacteroidetes bacterium]|nr:DUF1684 domain-containing protein [Bacteroidota bacterium]
MKNIFGSYVFFIFLGFAFGSCSQSSSQFGLSTEDINYIQSIQSFRNTQDSLFRISKESPFYKHKNFTKLNYFEPNSQYRVLVKVASQIDPEIIQFQTNTERMPVYLKKYLFDFTLSGHRDSLWGYINNKSPNRIFVPFKDFTNGTTTYGGGRYMDIDLEQGKDSVWLDFNTAYNPYCHYDTGYSCPIVPKENYLQIAVEAGEKIYK